MIGRNRRFLYFSPVFVWVSPAALLKIGLIGASWHAPQSELLLPINQFIHQEEFER
jgi:hypothetical protein